MCMLWIGKQISNLRKSQGLSCRELIQGLCSEQELLNIENGSLNSDKLLIDIIIQRLGKSPDKLEVILSNKAYQTELMRDEYEELLEKRQEHEAEQLLERYRAKFPKKTPVQKMFYYRSKAYAAYRLHYNLKEAEEWMWIALKTTLNGWQHIHFEHYRISTIEMENLLAYARIVLEMPHEEKWEHEMGILVKDRLKWVEKLLTACRCYIDQKMTDGEEHAKIFGKCAWLLGRCLHTHGQYKEALDLCNLALSELRAYGISYFMLPLFELLEHCANNLGISENYSHYLKYQSVLLHLRKEYGEDWHFTDSLFHNCYQKEYHLDSEIIHGERLARKETQLKFIEGIYQSPENLSKIENGKASPGNVKFEQIMNKVGLEKERYNPYIVSDSFRELELKKEINSLLNRHRVFEAEAMLNILKKSINMSCSENSKIILYYENLIAFLEHRVPYPVLLEKIKDLLSTTYRVLDNNEYRSPFELEALMINFIGLILEKLSRKEEKLKILKTILTRMDASIIHPKYRYRSYHLILENLAMDTHSVELAQKAIKYSLYCGKLNDLHINYLTIACAWINNPEKQEICKKMLVDIYYLSELAMNEKNRDTVLHYYEKKFRKPMFSY